LFFNLICSSSTRIFLSIYFKLPDCIKEQNKVLSLYKVKWFQSSLKNNICYSGFPCNSEFIESQIQKIESYSFQRIKKITSSFGVSDSRKGDQIADIEKRADDDLYQAEYEGRNLVRYK